MLETPLNFKGSKLWGVPPTKAFGRPAPVVAVCAYPEIVKNGATKETNSPQIPKQPVSWCVTIFCFLKSRMYQSGHWSLLKIESFEDLLVPCFWWYCNSSMEFGACIPHSQQRISILTFCHVHPSKQTTSRVSCKTDQQLGLSSYAELPNHTIPPIFWFSGTWHCKRKPRKSWRHLMFHLLHAAIRRLGWIPVWLSMLWFHTSGQIIYHLSPNWKCLEWSSTVDGQIQQHLGFS